MKVFAAVLAGLLASTGATPITKGYGTPLAPVAVVPAPAPVVPAPPVVVPPPQPIQQVTLGQPAPALEPVALRAQPLLRPVPFAPSPLRLLNQPIAPAPFALPTAPVALPRAAPLPLPAPAAPPALRLLNQPVAAPLALPAARAPVALPLNAAPAPVPLPLAAAAPAPIASAPVPVPSSQFHAQDEAGGFSFGYANQNSAKQESRTPDGVTRGSYSYVDANGIPQHVEYIADPVNGFRVAASNLPVVPAGPIAAPLAAGPVVVADTPEVAAAKAEFERAFAEAVARNAEADAEELVAVDAVEDEEALPAKVTLLARKKRSPITPGYGVPAAPVVTVAPAPVVPVAPAPVVPAPVVPVAQPVPTPLAPVAVGPQVIRSIAPIAPVIPGPVRVAPRDPLGVPTPVAGLRFAPAPAPLPLAAAPAPLPLAAAPAPLPLATVPTPVTPAVISAPSSQFQAQDEAGGYSFGYQNLNSGRQESRTADGVTTGSYSYVDANGVPQTVNYIADALGFRVTGTNLPVAPVVA